MHRSVEVGLARRGIEVELGALGSRFRVVYVKEGGAVK